MTIFISGTRPYISEIVKEVRHLLNDADGIRWTNDDLFAAISAAERQIVVMLPETTMCQVVLQLVAGCSQEIQGLSLIDIRENMGADGQTSGKFPSRMSFDQLDRLFPSRTDIAVHTPDAEVQLWAYDPREKKKFTVFPPQPETNQGYLKAKVSVFPQGITKLSDQSFLDREYVSAIVEFVLSFCFKRDAEFGDYANRSLVHYQVFESLLGIGSAGSAVAAAREKGES